MPNWKKVIISGSSAALTTVTATAGFTGSLFGTASYATQALSASWAPGGNPFPYTGSAEITGSLGVTGSFNLQTFNGLTDVTALDFGGVTRAINDVMGSTSINADDRELYDSNNILSTNWEIRSLIDTSTSQSVDWENRYLRDSSNTAVANWDAFARDYKIEAYTYLKKLISPATQDSFSDVPYIGGFNYEGEVIGAVVDVTVNQFDLVYLETDGKWYPVTQGTADCSKLLGICAVTGGKGAIILEGSITINDGSYTDTPVVQSPSHGLPIYIRDGGGNTMSTVVPTTAGQYVRILGHIYYQQSGTPEYWIMKFRPSNEWIEL